MYILTKFGGHCASISRTVDFLKKLSKSDNLTWLDDVTHIDGTSAAPRG
jgi:hypothetical protein